ncbi:glycosyltransferase family 2 protein [Francisella tularensis]|uniref:glycosyltransferase family 2 protein n=1 Tax=Francisella tularensis TaxID=263 RepID=UPI0008F4790E|nr:glycosyltransferase [Francisella tularensis]APA83383.1 putative glycosyltransferase [Francisella tularensis subsp. novicida PA10-7858]
MIREEYEVISNWKSFNNPLVSICCITYNHEKYIKQALDGFLMQETNFPFEIIVRDDASTDKTAEVIREYEKRYPNIIKPIYEKENTYSKGVKPSLVCFNKAMGDYIALCEGDDYWTDPKKLQIQIESMKKYADVKISFHKAYKEQGEKKQYICDYKKTRVFQLNDVLFGDGGFMPTASIVFLKECIKDFPEWFYSKAPVGDYFIQIFCSKKGGALYIDKAMSVYRVGHQGSWSQNNDNFYKQFLLRRRINNCLRYLNKSWDYEYTKEIKKTITMHNKIVILEVLKRTHLYSFIKKLKLFYIKISLTK